MKKFIGIIVLILVIGGGFFAWNVIQQQQVIDEIPDAQVGSADQQTNSDETTLEDQEDELDDVAMAQDKSTAGTSDEVQGQDKEGFVLTLTSTPAGLTQETESDVVVNLDETYLQFAAYGPGKSHTGTFETMQATIEFDDVKTVTGGLLTIEAASVKSDSAGLDQHLKSEDFFDVDQYPTIEYVLNGVIFNSGSGEASGQGTLTFHGVTQEITTPVTILPNGFNTKFNISMKDFGIEYLGVNDEVTIEAQVIFE